MHFVFKFPSQNYRAYFLQRQKIPKLQFYLLNDALQKEQKARNEFYTAEAFINGQHD